MKERTAAYIRVSTMEQKLHGLSLDAQRDTLKRYAESHDLEIVAWYEDEGISGRKEVRKRPALQRMMKDAEKEMFKRIIFIKLDRYFRSVGEYYACQKILDAHHILWSATNEEYDLTTATGRLLVSQKLAISEYEADNTSERIRLVNEYKVRQGTALYGRGALHIGFTTSKTPKGKIVIHDPEKEHIAKDIISTFILKKSLFGTAKYINQKHGTSFEIRSIKSFLQDTKLYGSYRGNNNYCEPYISKEQFDEIQSMLTTNIKHTPSGIIYLFTGMIKCPVCGRILSANANQGRMKTSEHYYRCNKAIYNAGCTRRKTKSESKLERELLLILNGEVKSYIHDAKESNSSSVLYDTKPIQDEIHRLNKIFQKGRIAEKEYDREYAKLESQLNEYMSKNKTRKTVDVSKYEELLKEDWKKMYSELDQLGKQEFWHNIIREIHLNDDGNVSELIFF